MLSAVQSNQTLAASTELDILEKSIKDIIAMIDRVLAYVQSVTSGEIAGDERIGRKLLDSLGSSVEGLERDNMESLFTAHLQVRSRPQQHLSDVDIRASSRIPSWSHTSATSSAPRLRSPLVLCY